MAGAQIWLMPRRSPNWASCSTNLPEGFPTTVRLIFSEEEIEALPRTLEGYEAARCTAVALEMVADSYEPLLQCDRIQQILVCCISSRCGGSHVGRLLRLRSRPCDPRATQKEA